MGNEWEKLKESFSDSRFKSLVDDLSVILRVIEDEVVKILEKYTMDDIAPEIKGLIKDIIAAVKELWENIKEQVIPILWELYEEIKEDLSKIWDIIKNFIDNMYQ